MAMFNPTGDTSQTITGGDPLRRAALFNPQPDTGASQYQGTDASMNPLTNAPYSQGTGYDAGWDLNNPINYQKPTPEQTQAAAAQMAPMFTQGLQNVMGGWGGGTGTTDGNPAYGGLPSTSQYGSQNQAYDPSNQANSMATAQATGFGGNNPGGITPSGTGVPQVGASTSTGTPAPPSAPQTPKNNPFTYQWLQNGSMTNPAPNGTITQGVNSQQWATPDTAQNIAQQFGGNTFQNNGGNFGSFSDPQQMIGFGNGNQINAGLAGDALSKYGSAPGSYGNYLVQRDITPGIPDPWANKVDPNAAARNQQGYQQSKQFSDYLRNLQQQQGSNLSAQDISDRMSGKTQAPTYDQMYQQTVNAMGYDPKQWGQPGYGQQGQQAQGQQQGGQNPMSQLSMLMPLLSMLFGGNFPGQGQGQGQQRPPMLPNQYHGYPFFSQFA